jgi:mannosyltransferase
MRKPLAIFLGLYALILVLLIPSKGLWMDEIIDLNGVRGAPDVNAVLAFVPGNAGGVPLGYLVDFAMIRTFGYSVAAVRIPSILFTALACAGVFILARQTGLRWPMLAVVAYAVSPMTLRYALEARPYAQASCWGIFASVMFLSLARQPNIGKAVGYAALVALGLYTQPYSIFVPVAHLLWLVFAKQKSRTILLAGSAVALAALSFLPWFFKIHSAWQGTLSSGTRFAVSGKDLLVIPHELMGTGYIGAGLTLLAVVIALGWSTISTDQKFFWAIYAAIPLMLVPAADAYFGYFLAARQLIFVLVPISILIAASAQVRWGLLVPAALLIAMVYEDVRWIRRPGEGWQPAASQLSQFTQQEADPGNCAMFIPSGARSMYLFFEPHVIVCDEGTFAHFAGVALALSPDQPPSAYTGARQELERAGFRKYADLRVSDPLIDVYHK